MFVQAVYVLAIDFAARAFRITPCEVKVGFGKSLCSFKVGATVYALGWVPLGGYTKFLNEDDKDSAGIDPRLEPGRFLASSPFVRMSVMMAGPLSSLLLGLILLGVPVMTESNQLALTTQEKSIIQPCSFTGLTVLPQPSTWEGQWQFFRDTWLDLIRRLFLFESLDGRAYLVGFFVTSGLAAEISVSAWMTMMASLALFNGVFNLLPLPVLNGGHLVFLLIESLIGRARESVLVGSMYIGLLFVLVMFGRLVWADCVWVWDNERTLFWILLAVFGGRIVVGMIRGSSKPEDTAGESPALEPD
jgi:membrane-associated protease RseP (regulator of RpoE activity)